MNRTTFVPNRVMVLGILIVLYGLIGAGAVFTARRTVGFDLALGLITAIAVAGVIMAIGGLPRSTRGGTLVEYDGTTRVNGNSKSFSMLSDIHPKVLLPLGAILVVACCGGALSFVAQHVSVY